MVSSVALLLLAPRKLKLTLRFFENLLSCGMRTTICLSQSGLAAGPAYSTGI